MPRPRTKLQVTTFPFLAVLLCAMGSLLLFLFIMDRRAKIVAQNRARDAAQAVADQKKETQAEQDARQAEWEQAKEKLRQLLLAQQKSLDADARTVEKNLLDADRLLEIAQTRFLELQPKLGSEAAKIASIQHQIERERDSIKATDRQEEASKLERTKATLELAELTIAFQELRARRSREKETYSLVPYRGKQGDARTPIYVECVGDGLLFHPERTALVGDGFTIPALRSEVERRTGPLQLDKTDRDKARLPAEEKQGPYLLFLVRPAGIASYYKAQAGLRGFQLDFGYELVDEDWVLDFGGSTSGPDTGVSKLAAHKPVPPPPLPLPGILPPAAPAPLASLPAAPGPLVASTPGPEPSAPSTSLPSVPAPVVALPSAPAPAPAAMTLGKPAANPPDGPGAGLPLMPVPTPTGNSNVAAAPPSIRLTPPATPGEPAFVPLSRTAARPAMPAPPSATGQPALIASSTPPTGAPVSATPQPVSPQASAPPPATPMGAGPGPEESPSLDPIISRGPVQPTYGAKEPKKTPTPAPVNRIAINKDFVITIDCYDDHVNVFPGGTQFRWKGTNPRDTDRRVAQTIATLIERRQASAREGEPPYRPIIRFQVSPEGLRTYLHVYPLLEPLRVPMTRINVED